VIIAALLPIVIVGLVDVGGWNGLMDGIRESNLASPACTPSRAPVPAT
jgi:hypothetical protein